MTPNEGAQGLITKDESGTVLLVGGKGGAKTLSAAVRVAKVCARDRGQRAMIMREAKPDLVATTGETFAFVLARIANPEVEENEVTFETLKMLPPDLCQWKNQPVPHVYLPLSNARVFFRHLREAEGFGGYKHGIIWMDEVSEMKVDSYREADRRKRQAGVTRQLVMSTNPPRETGHWLEREFPDAIGSSEIHLLLTGNRSVWQVSAQENAAHLPEDYFSNLSLLPESERRWLIDGKLGSVFGRWPRVFPEFRYATHVARSLLPFPGYPIIRGFDVMALGQVIASVAYSEGPKGRIRVLREWEEEGMGIEDFGREVMSDSLRYWGAESEFRDGGDPAAFAVSFTDKRSAADALLAAGIVMLGGQNSRTERRERIAALLNRMVEGEPAIQFDEAGCRRLIAAMDGGYTHDAPKGPLSHVVDSFGYGLTAHTLPHQGRNDFVEPRRPSYNFRSPLATERRPTLPAPADKHNDGYGRFVS